MHRLYYSLALVLTSLTFPLLGQTLIMNEVSQGESGNQEYVEFIVVDASVVYDCNATTPPCIDIRGWIFDDNSGYHGAGGVAPGCVRFSFDPLWSCVPLGTIIVIYNNADPNPLMPADDISLTDGNCSIVAPISNASLFESNSTTPGAAACSYPATGWTPGGSWNNTLLANGADCARIVDLGGCEVFSVCWNTDNLNNLVYFPGGATSGTSAINTVYYFNGIDPTNQLNWSVGCADVPACGVENQTPGAPNNAVNAAYISQYNNACNPITPIVASIVSSVNATCACDGQATAAGSGSIPGYTYEWFDNLFVPIGQTSANVTGLCAGTYNVIVTSSIGCSDTATVTITSSGGTTVAVNSTSICAGSSATLTANPSVGGGTYSWAPGGQTTQSINVSPGTTTVYTVRYDLSGCISTGNGTVTITPQTIPLFAPLTAVCQNAPAPVLPVTSTNSITGSWSPVVSTANPGITTYTFTPNGGQCAAITTLDVTVIPGYSEAVAVALCSGSNYTYPDGIVSTNITVPESHVSNLLTTAGCDSIITTTISLGGILTTNIVVFVCSESNFTYADGTVSTNVTANESHTSTFSSVSGCDSLVTENLMINPVYTIAQNISLCANQTFTYPDGFTEVITANSTHTSGLLTVAGCDSIIVTNVTMNPVYNLSENVSVCANSAYTYPDGTTEVITASTSHTSNLLAASGCDSIVVTNVLMNSIYPVQTNSSLCHGSDFTYPDGSISTDITADEFHISLFTSSNGCDSLVQTSITVIPLPAANAGLDHSICEGASVALSAHDLGGNTISWSNAVLDGVEFSPVNTQVYTLTVTNAFGCINTDSVLVEVNENPVAQFVGDNLTGCAPLEVSFTNLSTGGSFANCFWEFGDGSSSSDCGDLQHTYTATGPYSVSLTVVNSAGCTSSINLMDYVNVTPTPIAAFTSNQQELNILDTEVDFLNNSVNADAYLWDFGDFTSNSSEENPTHFYPEAGATYTITLTASNSDGCEDTALLMLSVKDVIIYYVPNAFTPDADEYNNEFKPVFTSGYDPYDYSLLIFNRWGEILFESHDVNRGWDGTYNGEMVQDGSYTWKIEFKETMTDERHVDIGHVSKLL